MSLIISPYGRLAAGSPTDHLFNYTITATGTENVCTYPDQNFSWTVTGTGTESWMMECGLLDNQEVDVSGVMENKTFYLYPPAGITIRLWDYTVNYSENGGKDNGTYLDTENNRLVIKVYTGGGYSGSTPYGGAYRATYRIYGIDQQQITTVLLGEWSISVYGYKEYRQFYFTAPPYSIITSWSYTVDYSLYGGSDGGSYIDYRKDSHKLVIRAYTGGSGTWSKLNGLYYATYRIYGIRLQQTSTVTATDSGSGSVNALEGIKDMGAFDAYPSPLHGGVITDVTYTIVDDNPYVDTWIANGHVYARTSYSEEIIQPWSATETGSGSVNSDEGNKYIATSTLVAPNGDTSWSVSNDNPLHVNTWMDGNKLYASVINTPPNKPADLQPSGRITETEATLSAYVADDDGDDINVFFYNNADDSLIDNVWVKNQSTAEVTWSGLTRGMNYSFYAVAHDGNEWSEKSDIQTFVVTLSAVIDIDPDTLNLRSKGKWITCYIELPESYSVGNIDIGTVRLIIGGNEVSTEPQPFDICDHDKDGIPDLMVKFSRQAVQALLEAGVNEVKVVGEVAGIPFEGSDIIKVI
ncbi:MAG: fibronectin type III domain-containing protein [Candidatus Hadarchaeum sp.]